VLNSEAHINWTTIDITRARTGGRTAAGNEQLPEQPAGLRERTDYRLGPAFPDLRFNPAFERLTGYQSHEVIGLGLDMLFPEDKKEECMKLIRPDAFRRTLGSSGNTDPAGRRPGPHSAVEFG